MFAIIKTGGKQYLISAGDKIKIEKIDTEEGKEVVFDEVLLLGKDEKDIKIGDPLVKGAKVNAKVIKQDRAKKIIIFKYKPKKRYKNKKGHRQLYTEVEILKILSSSAKSAT
ncbi:MAG: 50S ribosomal protein L21 [Patescibacteria group bacterium]|nr:50S ribosomal protein L21 [Patescibacteria group bacterium]